VSLWDGVEVPLGASTYAEPFAADTLLKMPANALVNVGYLLVAAYWLLECRRWPESDPRRPWRAYAMAMACLAGIYGPIQFWRIVSQSKPAAVLDQWITLPFFGLVVAWNLARRSSPSPTNSRPALTALLMLASVASYGLAWINADGFVWALSAHLILVVGTSIDALVHDRFETQRPFMLALLCCIGFVVLKEADFALAALAPFQRFTGHFWSKICDALQIHFVLRFITEGQLARARVLARTRDNTESVGASATPFTRGAG
jgi:hypothetical protein